MTMLDSEIIELLDFDFVPPCESSQPKIIYWCGNKNPAEWRTVSSCCGKVRLHCDECLQAKLNHKPGLFCLFCHSKFTPGRLLYASIERM